MDVYMYAPNFSEGFGFISICQYSLMMRFWGLLDISKLLMKKTKKFKNESFSAVYLIHTEIKKIY